MVEFLLDKNASINHVDIVNQNSLFYSVILSDFQMAKLLLEKGINVNHHDKDKKTALFHAKWKENQEIIQLLLDHNAINTKDGWLTKSEFIKKKKDKKQDKNWDAFKKIKK